MPLSPIYEKKPDQPGGHFGFMRVRLVLLTVNLAMILLAIPVLLLSLSVLLQHDDQVKEGYLIEKNYATYCSVLLAGCSSIMIITGIIGQVSIHTNFTRGTIIYMWISLALIAIQLMIIGCVFVWKDHLYHMIKLQLDESLDLYLDNRVVRDHWDHLQMRLDCCGDEGPHTWQNVFYNLDFQDALESEIDPWLPKDLSVVPLSCISPQYLLTLTTAQGDNKVDTKICPNVRNTVPDNQRETAKDNSNMSRVSSGDNTLIERQSQEPSESNINVNNFTQNVNSKRILLYRPDEPTSNTKVNSQKGETTCAQLTYDLEVFETGCVEAVSEYLITHINLIAYVALVYLLMEIIAAILAFRLRHLAVKIGILD